MLTWNEMTRNELEQRMDLLHRNGYFFIGGIIATAILVWFLIDMLLSYGPT